MKKINSIFFVILLTIVSASSCTKDDEPEDPIIPNEEEVITTLNFTLVPDGGGDTLLFSFQDLDGDGGNDAIIIVDTLAANTTYTGSLDLLNELETPAESITEEIEEEAEEHQFFYQPENLGVNVTYDDSDANGNPIGLSTILTTNGVSSGIITVTLRHEPDKNADGVSTGDITNAGGETDIEVTFIVHVE